MAPRSEARGRCGYFQADPDRAGLSVLGKFGQLVCVLLSRVSWNVHVELNVLTCAHDGDA